MLKINILIIYGGISFLRKGSLASGENILKALCNLQYNVSIFEYNGNIKELQDFLLKNDIDLVFNIMHGKNGEDGITQGFLDFIKIPYIGTGVLGSALAMNKYMSKLVLRGAGYKVADGVCIRSVDMDKFPYILEEKRISYPVIVKPNNHGAKLGTSLALDKVELLNSLDEAFKYDYEVIIEKYINGAEVAVCMYYGSNQERIILPIVQIEHEAEDKTKDRTFMLNEKTRHVTPAKIGKSEHDRVLSIAEGVFDLFSIKDYGRIDMIIENNEVYILEVSNIPGFAENNVFPKAIRSTGLSNACVLKEIINSAIERYGIHEKK